MSLSDISESEDDLFNTTGKQTYETVETVPLRREGQDDDGHSDSDSDNIGETMATLPLHPGNAGTQSLNTGRLTQPTQIMDRSANHNISSPTAPTVQVTASSPLPTPVPVRKQSSILASAMAPAGTAFRRPFIPPQRPKQAITIDSDDEGPTYQGGSSDEDKDDLRRNDIKTTTFQRKVPDQTDKIPESPAKGNSLFKSITSAAIYNGGATGVKRPYDSTPIYGTVYKKPRQTGPSRALPIAQQEEQDMAIEDIMDYNARQKVKRMVSMLTDVTVRDCYNTLKAKKGDYDDAIGEILIRNEKREAKQKKNPIDLTGSDDELMPTPAGPKKHVTAPIRQQAKVPQKSIAEKWSSTQHVNRAVPKRLDVFDTPPKKNRTLVRGRKDRSSPPAVAHTSESLTKRASTVISDESDEADSGVHSNAEEVQGQDTVLEFFNTCTVADLIDTAVIKPSLAEHILAQRPFKTLNAVRKIESPDLKPSKGKRKNPPIGDRVVDKVDEMIVSYEAVDYLVRKCESIAKPLTTEMKNWGVNVYGNQSGELEMVSLHDSQMSSHDSGIGTPVSEDERDNVKKAAQRKYIGQPSIMSEDLRMKDYQIVGLNWLKLLYSRNLSCILADDMGLGKTCQVIAFLAHLLEIGERGPHLVVVPAATLENWLKEFHRFCPALVVEPYYSTQPGEREGLRAQIEEDRDNINVIVTTYTLAKGKEDSPWLKHFGFTCTIYDEGHILKNADSQVSRKLVRINSKFRLLLTGTPLQNNLKELISLLGFLMPSLFREKEEELQAIFTHNVKALDENHEALLSAQRIARARSMLIPFILRRKKYQVLKDLPKKERRVEYCDMTPEQVEIYQMWLEKAYSIRERRERGENVTNESSNILMRLRQAAIHPFLFRRIYKDKQLPLIAKQCLKDEQWSASNPDLIVTELLAYSDMEVHKLCEGRPVLQRFALNNNEWMASGKVQKTIELLREFMSAGHRTLIFSQFVMVLDILELVLEREAIAYFRLDGNTKVSERQDLIDEFSDDNNQTPVFMLSTRAGGAGINLAKANKVIVFDSGFNPQDDIQAENRAHRIGQVKEVEVIRLVSKGTVEEQIYAMGLTKLRLDEQVAGDGTEEAQQPEGEGFKPKKENDESEQEKEGRKMVEDMFFQKLDTTSKDEAVKDLQDATIHDTVSSEAKLTTGAISEPSSQSIVTEKENTEPRNNDTDDEDDYVIIDKNGNEKEEEFQETKPKEIRSNSTDLVSRPRRNLGKAIVTSKSNSRASSRANSRPSSQTRLSFAKVG